MSRYVVPCFIFVNRNYRNKNIKKCYNFYVDSLISKLSMFLEATYVTYILTPTTVTIFLQYIIIVTD